MQRTKPRTIAPSPKSTLQLQTPVDPKDVTANPDYQLILDCCSVAASLAAWEAAFRGDPSGSSEHATKIGDRYCNGAYRLVEKLAETPARTVAGHLAKARIVPLILADDRHGTLQPHTEAFVASFTADVRKFLESVQEVVGPRASNDFSKAATA